MKKEDITLVAQLLAGMKEAVVQLEKSRQVQNKEEEKIAREEILSFQKQISKII